MNKKIQFKLKRAIFLPKAALLSALLCCFCMTITPVGANTKSDYSLAQAMQQKNVTVNIKNKQLKSVLYEFQKQSSINFVIQEDALDLSLRNYSITVNNVAVKVALEQLLKGSGLTYKISENTVFISKTVEKKEGKILQKMTVKGRVVNSQTKDPIVGATVVVDGTTNGAITDTKGEFILTAKSDDKLEVTFIGMKPILYTKTLSSDGVLTLIMDEDAIAVDDVIVNGYYSRTKESMTGSAVVVKAEDLKRISPNNIFKALEAFEPSFQVVENKEAGSNPNNVPDILIRGKSSFEGKSNNPLFILDGYEVSIETVFDFDVERISQIVILKDAAATAVYGSRAANGVVVIESKIPAQGKLAVSYSLNASIEAPDLTDYDLMNAREKLLFESFAGVYKGSNPRDQIEKDKMYQNRYHEMLRGVDTYWLSKPLQTAFKHQHSLSLSGGNERSRYGLNVNYGSTPGVMMGSSRERLGFNFTWTYMVSNKIRIGNSLSVNQNTSKDSPYGSFDNYSGLNPYERTHDTNGNIILKLSDGTVNPLYDASLNNFSKSKSTSYSDSFDVEWTVAKGLRVTGRVSYNYSINEGDIFKSPQSYEFLNKETAERGKYSSTHGNNSSIDGNIVVNYYTMLGEKHSLSASVGTNMQRSLQGSKSFSAQGFLSDNLTNIDFSLNYPKDGKPTGKQEESRLFGVFGNAGYAYDNRYMVDFSYRTDGSSKFGAKDRFAPFWGAGLAWNIHNEKFWKKNDLLTMAKIRSSLGYTGTVSFEANQSKTMYEYTPDNMYMHGIGADIKALGNENLKWQRQFSANIGVDLDIKSGLFSLTGEIYQQKTKDLLIDMTIPPSLGFTSYKENFGEMTNRGWELSLRSQVIRNQKRNVYWSLSFGTGGNKNKVDKISNALASFNEEANKEETKKPTALFEEGESLDALKVVMSHGIDPVTGKEIFINRFGQYTTVWDYRDKVYVGTTTPKFRGSLNSFLSVKGVTLNISLSMQLGAKSYNQTLAERVEGINPTRNGDRRALNLRWKEVGDKTFYKNIALKESTSNLTSRFVQNYNFLQISSVSVGYSLPQSWCNKIYFKNVRMNFNMSDLARFSTVKEERGLSYPFARQFTFSLSVQL